MCIFSMSKAVNRKRAIATSETPSQAAKAAKSTKSTEGDYIELEDYSLQLADMEKESAEEVTKPSTEASQEPADQEQAIGENANQDRSQEASRSTKQKDARPKTNVEPNIEQLVERAMQQMPSFSGIGYSARQLASKALKLLPRFDVDNDKRMYFSAFVNFIIRFGYNNFLDAIEGAIYRFFTGEDLEQAFQELIVFAESEPIREPIREENQYRDYGRSHDARYGAPDGASGRNQHGDHTQPRSRSPCELTPLSRANAMPIVDPRIISSNYPPLKPQMYTGTMILVPKNLSPSKLDAIFRILES